MAEQAVNFVARSYNAVIDLFLTMLDVTGLSGFYISMLGLLFIVSYLLSGFLVPVSSDTIVVPKGRSDSNTNAFSSPRKAQTRNSRPRSNYDANRSRGKSNDGNS